MLTYAQFLLIFLGIPLLILAFATWRDLRKRLRLPPVLRNLPAWLLISVHILIAVVYTTPWDNYLVATGVWSYHPNLVAGLTLGWVPVEEYAFFILQTLLAGLWLVWLARRLPVSNLTGKTGPRLRILAPLFMAVLWVIMVALLASRWSPATYLGLILVWALPPIMLQLAFGADLLWRSRLLVSLAIGTLTVYLSLTDSLAIGGGTWTIAPGQSLNLYLGGVLPVEEFIFFLVTNILIVFGILLALHTESRERSRRVVARLQAWRAILGQNVDPRHRGQENPHPGGHDDPQIV